MLLVHLVSSKLAIEYVGVVARLVADCINSVCMIVSGFLIIFNYGCTAFTVILSMCVIQSCFHLNNAVYIFFIITYPIKIMEYSVSKKYLIMSLFTMMSLVILTPILITENLDSCNITGSSKVLSLASGIVSIIGLAILGASVCLASNARTKKELAHETKTILVTIVLPSIGIIIGAWYPDIGNDARYLIFSLCIALSSICNFGACVFYIFNEDVQKAIKRIFRRNDM
uniref:G_PROTEIN_RECEP_F1_2 domain-containing protein n=1 Tax=Rhabditophanes sp. KR3021 TaxID=114890 RepID=A0AC35U4I8_9BILA